MTAPPLDIIDFDAADGFTPTLDTPPEPSEGGDLWCETGNHYFTHTGRGRKPRNCPDHRTRAGKPSQSRDRKVAEIENDLAGLIAMVGASSAALTPVTGMVLVDRSPITANAIVAVCRDNPRAMAILAKISKVAPGAVIGQTVGMMVVGIGVDTGKLEPEHPAVQLTGVAQYVKTFQESQSRMASVHPMPSRFEPVA